MTSFTRAIPNDNPGGSTAGELRAAMDQLFPHYAASLFPYSDHRGHPLTLGMPIIWAPLGSIRRASITMLARWQ